MCAWSSDSGATRCAAWCAAILITGALCGGCATPTGHAEALARAATLESTILHGGGFRLRAYLGRGPALQAAARGGRLHIYIDHDGSPWQAGRVSIDPTPRNPLALRLMALDKAPALYVGRPCHFALDTRPPCHPWLWTHARYGEAVVRGMAQAIQGFVMSGQFSELVLIGYSGGGTIAVLLAEHLPQTVAVVTLAANLDVDSWTRLHDYSPLTASLNPANRPPLNESIVQLHFVGGADRNVPPDLVYRYARHHADARVVEIADFDHVCCWVSLWPSVLVQAPFR